MPNQLVDNGQTETVLQRKVIQTVIEQRLGRIGFNSEFPNIGGFVYLGQTIIKRCTNALFTHTMSSLVFVCERCCVCNLLNFYLQLLPYNRHAMQMRQAVARVHLRN